MTKQESFKKRIRARMEKTGERYGAARRSLLESSEQSGRAWAEQPELDDAAVLDATGRGWGEWCDLIDAWPGHGDGHAAVAKHLQQDLEVDGWWAQTITVGWERITGRRRAHQRADGTFTAGKSRTVSIDAVGLRRLLLDDVERLDLFGGVKSELRSRPTSKALRFGMPDGVALIAIDGKQDGRATVTVAHERLPDAEDVERWKHYWSEWLDAIDET